MSLSENERWDAFRAGYEYAGLTIRPETSNIAFQNWRDDYLRLASEPIQPSPVSQADVGGTRVEAMIAELQSTVRHASLLDDDESLDQAIERVVRHFIHPAAPDGGLET